MRTGTFARLSLEPLEMRETPTAGVLDPTFGHAGLATNLPGSFAGATAVQPDGKILVGETTAPSPGSYVVYRLNADGSLDKSFGTGGHVSISIGSRFVSGPAVFVAPDGKILLTGYSGDLGQGPFTIVRLTAGGLPDPSFAADGVLVTGFTAALNPAFQPDGDVIVAGKYPSSAGVTIARYLAANYAGARTTSHTTLVVPPVNFLVPGVWTASVTGAGPTPTGSITFLEGTTILGAAPLDAHGQAGFLPPGYSLPFTPGAHSITAVYSGDAVYKASSASANFLVPKATAFVILTSSTATLAFGQPVTFTAEVTAAPANQTQGGTVTFLDGQKVLGVASVSYPSIFAPGIFPGVPTAVLTLANLGPGVHTITARYSGNSETVPALSPPVTITVAALPAATTTTLSAPLSAVYGQPVTLTAKVSGGGKPTGTVTFRDGTTVLGSATLGGNGKATFKVHLGAGVHHLTASYSGDAGDIASGSAAVAIAVARASTQIALSASPGAPVSGKPITFTARVFSTAADVLNTGVVTFMDGATLLGSASVTKGAATVKVPTLSAGKHTITVSYGGNANHAASKATFAVTVKPAR